MQLVPYLNFDGTCAEAFRFYERLLGGRLETIMTHEDSPIANEVGRADLRGAGRRRHGINCGAPAAEPAAAS